MSPSSLTVAGPAGTEVRIKDSFEIVPLKPERLKWRPYEGLRVVIHDPMWDNVHETVLVGFSPSDQYVMLIEDPVPFPILDDYVVDIAHYPDNTDAEDQLLAKRIFVFTNPTVPVLAGISQTQLTVAGGDVSKFREGALVMVHDPDEWDDASPEVRIIDITGSTLTFNRPLGFIPASGYEIELIGFKDGGAPYRYL